MFRNKHLYTAMWTCEETVFSITRFENRIQTALIFNFSTKYFFILPWWLVTEICDTDVISFSFENGGYAAHCCNQLAGNFCDRSFKAVFPFPNVERFRCLKIPNHSWILPCLKICDLVTDICYTDDIYVFWVWAFRHIHEYYSPQTISTIKYLRGSYRKLWATIFCKVTCFIIDKPITPP